MIRPPRRSVTRFFIPLIDVLILLFCIFLLMPIVEEAGAGPGGTARLTPGEIASLRHELDSLRPEVTRLRRRVTELEQTRELSQLKRLQDRIAQLEQEKARAADATALRLLHFEIDPRTGALIYYNPDRKEIHYPRDAAVLTKLIDEDLVAARKSKQQLVWVFLFPRGPAFHPTEAEIQALEAFLQQRRDDGLRVRWETLRGLNQGGKP